MRKQAGMGSLLAMVVLACGPVSLAADLAAMEEAIAHLKAERPRARVYTSEERVTRVYGQPLSFGATPEVSAEQFRVNHAELFGVDADDLEPAGFTADAPLTQPVMYDRQTGQYKFTLVRYAQRKNGIPVFRSDLRLLVRNEAESPLVLASSGLRPLGAFEVGPGLLADIARSDFLSAGFAAARQEALRGVPDLVNFSDPDVVIWAGVDDIKVSPRVALKFIADNFGPGGASDQKRLYLADIESGEILYEESAIVDVDGNASGNASQGPGADYCASEALTPLPYLRVTSGANGTFTGANGNFSVTAGAGTVDATLADGQWFDIENFAGSVESVSVSASTPANLVFNAANSNELVRAQTNGYAGANVVRDFVVQYNPAYPTFTDTNIPCWVNRTDGYCPGNAWYDPADFSSPTGYSINFCQSGSGYPNTAWTSVIYHEFGHHLVAAAGSGQDQYGEGAGDCMSVILLDDPRVGLGFFGTCDLAGTLRNADNSMQYPCTSEAHACAPLLSGCIWDTREQLIVTEPVDYLDILGDLMVNSILLHTGSTITPQITIDWLTLDDTDANIGNGTPHYSEICTGFGAHNMDCPPLDVGMTVGPTADFESSGEVGGPFTPDSKIYTIENLGPGGITYNVTTGASWVTIANGSGSLPTVGSTAQVTISINANASTLPVGRYEATVNFINTTDGTGNTVRFVRLAIGIPDDCSSATPVCPGAISDSTVDMTNDGSASCGTSNSSPDMWYSYTPATSGSATFSLCTGTSYDSVLSVHSGCPGTSGNELGCDDDFCGGGGPSEVTLSVTGGNTYLIRVTGWSGASGAFTLTISGPDCVPEALVISLPGGLPETLQPGAATTFDVRIQDGAENYVLGSGTLHYRYDGGAYQTSTLTPLGGDLFQATLPPAVCADTPEFYVSAEGHLGSVVTSPETAPAGVYAAPVGASVVVMSDNFQTNQGWTAQNLGATSGNWQRGVPVNDPNWDYDPASDSDGSGQCYLTQNQVGNTDVDDGSVRLTSPTIDMSGGVLGISYDYYLYLTTASENNDVLLVEIDSNNGLGPWTQIARHNTNGGLNWRHHEISAADLSAAGVTLTSTMKLRFTANDAITASIVEAGLDAFEVVGVECVDVGNGDFEPDGDRDLGDFGMFQFCFGQTGSVSSECKPGDMNGDQSIDLTDYAMFGLAIGSSGPE